MKFMSVTVAALVMGATASALAADLGVRPYSQATAIYNWTGFYIGGHVGGGLEYMFAPNWSAKVEYQYYNFGDSAFVTPAALAAFGSFHNDEHTVKAGLNYRFNLGGPVVAKY